MVTVDLDERGSFVWIAHPLETLERASTALALDGGCLLVDPVDRPGLDEALAPLGRVVGVCTLLGRHRRDAGALARRHGAPLLVPSVLAGAGEPLDIAGIQERAILAAPGWNEAALWLPERRLLVCAEAVGTSAYFRASEDERLGVHPLLRLRPPAGALSGLDPVAIAVGHGPPVKDHAAEALEQALRTARRRLPRAWLRAAASFRPTRR